MLRYLMVFVPLLVVMAANGDNMLAALGMGGSALLSIGTAALVALLIFEYPPVHLVAAMMVAIAANLPAEAAVNLGFERDYALAALFSVLITPRIVRQMD